MGDQADFLVDKIINEHMSVGGLIDDLDWFNPKEKPHFGTKYIWITADGDELYYHQIGEQHARNILRQVLARGDEPAPPLLERIKYFDDKKPKWKELF